MEGAGNDNELFIDSNPSNGCHNSISMKITKQRARGMAEFSQKNDGKRKMNGS